MFAGTRRAPEIQLIHWVSAAIHGYPQRTCPLFRHRKRRQSETKYIYIYTIAGYSGYFEVLFLHRVAFMVLYIVYTRPYIYIYSYFCWRGLIFCSIPSHRTCHGLLLIPSRSDLQDSREHLFAHRGLRDTAARAPRGRLAEFD